MLIKGTVSQNLNKYLKDYDVECVFFQEPLMVFKKIYRLVIFKFENQILFTIFQIHFLIFQLYQ